jgi:hypothetical protein
MTALDPFTAHRPGGHRRRRRFRAAACGLAASLVLSLTTALPASSAPADVPSPTVTGPVPVTEDSRPFFAAEGLGERGYVEEEFFLEGTANRYETPPLATGTVIDGGHPYKTRMIVRRPADARRFNGTVVLEWLNVTAGWDLQAAWDANADHFLREGYAYVGLSAQRVGVDFLRGWDPERYGDLDVMVGDTITPSDALGYDIFSQAATALRSPTGTDPMGGLGVHRVIAAGASQSAGRLAVYYNSVHPLHGVIDAMQLAATAGSNVRADLATPVMKLVTETDVRYAASIADPDTDSYRRWEVAGTSHFPADSWRTFAGLIERDIVRGPLGPTICDAPPFSELPLHHVGNASFDHLVRWVRTGRPAPAAPRMRFTEDGQIARDERGNSLGGIRLPNHDVPTALNSGVNSGESPFCRLFGTHVPFDQATLDQLYRNRGVYVAKVTKATLRARKDGYLVRADARETLRQAAREELVAPETK